jgi:amino acid permease
MAEQFLGPVGKYIFYVFMIIYLFGDLAIFAVSVPATIIRATGTLPNVSRDWTHAIYVATFGAIVVPFSFANFQKTKYLQIFTLVTRNVALASMIILSIIFIAQGNGANIENVSWFRFDGLAGLFGTSIYAFMCHHSLPGIVSPIKNKVRINNN